MKTVFLFIPNYVYTSDVIRTKFLKLFAENTKVIVYLPTLDYVDTFPSIKNVEYKIWHTKSMRFWGYFKTLRLGLIKEFDDLLSIQVHYKNSFKDYRRKILRIIAKLLPFGLSARFFTRVEQFFLPMRPEFKVDVQKYNPEFVLVCTPGFTDFEAEVIILSKKIGIKTVAINFSWDNLTTNAKHIRHTDFLITWNNYIKNEAIKYHHYPDNAVKVSGSIRFDRYFTEKPTMSKESFLQSKKLDSLLPLVALTTTSHGVYPYHAELIDSLITGRQKGKFKNCNILVRVHPKDDIERYGKYENIRNLIIENPGHLRKITGDSRHKIEMEESDIKNLHNTLFSADIVINYGSTVTLEALVCGSEVINICYPDTGNTKHYLYVHYKPIIDSGSVFCAYNKEQLMGFIDDILSKAEKKDKESLIKSFFYKTDGQAYRRCANILNELIYK